MRPAHIAQRLVAKHGPHTAYGLCRGRVVLALRRKSDHRLYLWYLVGTMVERIGNAAGWE